MAVCIRSQDGIYLRYWCYFHAAWIDYYRLARGATRPR